MHYAARHTFDSEPSSPTILAFVLHGGWLRLFAHHLVGVRNHQPAALPSNAKRRQRTVSRQAQHCGISPLTQTALDQSRAAYRTTDRTREDSSAASDTSL